uniref:Membrane-associated guanylate kinase, WW and PDZ domain-containing protein 1 n=2 Tax=Clastoptera arizonana TaxID=38151 RepID=A0A1B6DAZ4_9HEMI
MQKIGQKRPSILDSAKPPASSTHWLQSANQISLTALQDGTLNFSIGGGSDNGKFAYVTDINQEKLNYITGVLCDQDIILEIQGQKVAGYTRRDTVAWLNHCCRNGAPVTIKTVPSGLITQDLCQFLNTRFQKGSVDHDLQNIIRDNLYLRTVPVTTREPRDNEVNGVDYTFLTIEEFIQLEENGCLLESGIYEGNHYGTPKPSREPYVSLPQSSGGIGTNSSVGSNIFPGAHPSSEGKRRRNRSNVEAMAAKNSTDPPQVNGPHPLSSVEPPKDKPPVSNFFTEGDPNSDPLLLDLGPLPPKWEKAYTEKGEVYFIDHNSSTSHWLDPRLSKFQKKSLEDCSDDELPYGWERIDDPMYGTYYIDHVNRQTQYENPVIQAKTARGNGSNEADGSESIHSVQPPNEIISNIGLPVDVENIEKEKEGETNLFTMNPNELMGERIQSTLVKSLRGLGFTIVGGDDSKEEFLQIKSVVPKGPAWLEGKLQTGDVLVYVNDKCVLGYTHHDMVSVFQSISPGETVKLEVNRGYPLPFDPNDPNTEVVTTVAVNAPDSESVDPHLFIEQELFLKNNNFLDLNNDSDITNHSVKSLPDLYVNRERGDKSSGGGIPGTSERPNSTDLILGPEMRPEFLTMSIVKGAMGFGFTIADSAYGQKVKKILDRQRCKNLMEGDILVDINNICVHRMCHSEVVQVLKDCTRNEEATITVQRGGARPLKKDDMRYRSKTPTVEVYGSRPKEVVAGRPKTPLVDTRSRPKTPTHDESMLDMDETWKFQNDSVYYNGYGPPVSDQTFCLDPHLGYYSVKKKESTSFEHEQPHNEGRFTRSLNMRPPTNFGVGIRHNLEYVETVVTLLRQETGFGFRIVGGTEEGSQVSIGHIVPGGAADIDGRLCTGDEIISVDNQSVLNTSHHHVVQLMGKAAAHGRVTLGIRRRIQNIQNFMRNSDVGYPYDVTVKRRENEGFGFVIISSLNKAGSTIGRIIEGSPAERCGHLHLGDNILAVNHIDIMNLNHGDIVNLIKDSGYSVTLTIGPPLDDDSSTTSVSASQRHEIEDEGEGEVHIDGDEAQYHAVELSRGTRGFGFSIRGGREFQNMSLFVLQIADNGPAALDGRLKIGDQIIEINGINTKNMTHSEAIEIIRNGGPSVRLLVRRGGRVPPLLPGEPGVTGNLLQQPYSLMCLNASSPTYWNSHFLHPHTSS